LDQMENLLLKAKVHLKEKKVVHLMDQMEKY